jgi:ATP/maltotriose-dependent transcriptional regulator MalT
MPIELLLPDHVRLTEGEHEVLVLLAAGCSNAAIAESLDLPLPTVKTRLRRFRDRTGLSGRQLHTWLREHYVCCLTAA